ncbi:gluconate kinase [Cryobacterium mesophilum]|nr:gluconate kinase [Terrimesophilobacter mesophilus]
MPPTLLTSQYLSLEPLQDDESGLRVDILQTPALMVASITKALHSAATASDL